MKRIFTYILVLIVSTSFSCKKDDPDKCKIVLEAPSTFLDYWFFPQGSWWVYKLKNSSPAIYDTITVSNSQSEYFEPGEPTGGLRTCLMFYQTTLQHSNTSYFLGDGKAGFEVQLSQEENSKWYVQQSSNISSHYSPEYIFFSPFNINESIPSGAIVVDTNSVVTPMQTFNQSVHLIYEFGSADSMVINFVKHIYITRKVGLSKIVYTHDKTWELVNYYINN